MKKNKKLIVIFMSLILVLLAWIMYCGYLWSWGPFAKLHNIKTAKLPGNGSEYDLDRVELQKDSPLSKLNICFLGSSVTYGSEAQQTSFVEYLAKRNGFQYIKEAVPGTTLVDEGVESYIARLKKIDKNSNFDLLICQLSTNDATLKKVLGSVGDSYALDDFNVKTVAGAIEYIIAYSKQTWNCPVVFYTSTYYENAEYANMVEVLNQIKDKWQIGVIDLYSDDEFNNISSENRNLYMADSIHPTKAGYSLWWIPYMENALINNPDWFSY